MTTTKPLLCSAALLLAAVTARGQAPTASPSPTPANVLSMRDLDASQETIRQAAQRGDMDTLFLAMQKYIEPEYCLGQVELMPRAKQAQFLARILSDKDILITAPFEGGGFFPSGSATLNSGMPGIIERWAYRLLGEPPPPPARGLMTRPQMDALAARLRAVR